MWVSATKFASERKRCCVSDPETNAPVCAGMRKAHEVQGGWRKPGVQGGERKGQGRERWGRAGPARES